MTRAELIKQAEHIVCHDREDQYGKPENNFSLIAEFWSAYLGKEVKAGDVALMMCLLKIARTVSVKTKEDNYVDLIGYAACAGEVTL